MAEPKAVLLDIEGTTSSISFVADELFPYARTRLPDFVASQREQLAPTLADIPGDDKVATLLAWMDEDRKATPLKTLQGMIWAEGYADGSLKGHVYPDTPAALRRWRAAGIAVYIYSSGSIAAQELLFRHSIEGDLTPLIQGYFDTTSGPKREPQSYVRIAAAIGLVPSAILFVSDAQTEVDAARLAGVEALLIAREGGGDVQNLAQVLA
ncbi:acireductone synthase [Sphingomonas psychrotolerans]|uniref:Enolase-phosphatase E1 n=1 Tax=Sphingomonas psychrotolerans TaxID=1327635 RepID=A0ABU3N2I9_9SPHN|nr:acireductone synthase [Sphingomonas psychrotolerans]MDT8757445.1 acireductone synthase [Sphingomonas psychrotolerans]